MSNKTITLTEAQLRAFVFDVLAIYHSRDLKTPYLSTLPDIPVMWIDDAGEYTNAMMHPLGGGEKRNAVYRNSGVHDWRGWRYDFVRWSE